MTNAIFIHFLNRELLRSIDIKKVTGIDFALKILLLAKDSYMYVPLSSIWEVGDSTDLDYDFFDLVYESKQIELISDCMTNEEFLDRNCQLYFYDRSRYDCYFFNVDKYRKYRPTILRKYGATSSIKNTLEKWKVNGRLSIQLPIRDKEIIKENKEKIYEINKKSEGRGITRSLFSGELEKEVHELSVARLLSVCYIKDYLKCIDGDIATGISSYMSYYDALAYSFPYNDIPVLNAILECAGVDKSIFCKEKNKEWFCFLQRRCNSQHLCICKYINEIIKECMYCRKNKSNIDLRVISNELVVYIKRISLQCSEKITRVCSVNQLNILENNLKILLDYFMKKERLLEENIGVGGNKIMRNKVFIVHGHNELLKEQVANWLYSLDLEPIILHKQANGGTKSIIDKIEKYSNVCCAIILLTADDTGKGKKEKSYKKRARQNVVFEAGYFIGKIGASNVILLHEEDVEIPGDLGGCVYILADDKNGWKEQVRLEFNEMGIDYRK